MTFCDESRVEVPSHKKMRQWSILIHSAQNGKTVDIDDDDSPDMKEVDEENMNDPRI